MSLEIEPGRYLVAESGFLLAEIRAIKQMGENTFYLLDTGFNDLARPILYGAYHPISIVHRQPRASSSEIEVVVGGPLCESGDIFTQEEGGFVAKRRLPSAAVGDWLVLEVAGAYGFVMASNYNGRCRAEEVLIEQGQMHSIRRRESFEDLIRGESIPAVMVSGEVVMVFWRKRASLPASASDTAASTDNPTEAVADTGP
ncbi:MAG: diaminopimelate decarboxylase family protein, partial [Pirellulaceae bacterium]